MKKKIIRKSTLAYYENRDCGCISILHEDYVERKQREVKEKSLILKGN